MLWVWTQEESPASSQPELAAGCWLAQRQRGHPKSQGRQPLDPEDLSGSVFRLWRCRKCLSGRPALTAKNHRGSEGAEREAVRNGQQIPSQRAQRILSRAITELFIHQGVCGQILVLVLVLVCPAQEVKRLGERTFTVQTGTTSQSCGH